MSGVITSFNHFPFVVTWGLQLVFCYAEVLLMMRYFGKAGIYVFISVMIIAANIEVNKLTYFPIFNQPIALGNTFIAATYLATDILTEYYDAKSARRGIWIGFAAMLMIVLAMIFATGFTPLSHAQANSIGDPHAFAVQGAFLTIFPQVSILLVASLFSFVLSQYTDIGIFVLVHRMTGKRGLWLRNNISTWLSALQDSIIFNLLAWRLFAIHPVPWHTLWVSYILGTFFLRVALAVLDTSFIYLARLTKPRHRYRRSRLD